MWGGADAYCMSYLIDGGETRLVPARDLPETWRELATRIATPPSVWAGLGSAPVVMGVLNVTPDSFSDGGEHLDPARAIGAGRAMIAAGAGVLDIGAESTRPGALPVSPAIEQARILPVIAALRTAGVPLSVDTRNAATMAAALDAGATIVNDVSALTHDPEAAALVATRGCPVVLMHMRGTPATMAEHAEYRDVAYEVVCELAERVHMAEQAGVARANVLIDPGIGFAKMQRHNLELLRRLPLLLNLGCLILVGVSRKASVSDPEKNFNPAERLPGSLAAGMFALSHGASMLRVHDVAATVQAIRIWQTLRESQKG